jgi:hypothetical protein
MSVACFIETMPIMVSFETIEEPWRLWKMKAKTAGVTG